MRGFATLLAAMLLLLFAATPVAAQYGDEDDESVSVSDTTLAPGEDVTVSGEDFTPGSTATISLDGAVLGSTTVADDGTFAVTVSIPASAACGDNTLDIVSDEGDAASFGITIDCTLAAAGDTVDTVDTDDGALATTGSNLTVGSALVVALFAAGGVALYATRRKTGIEA